MRSNMHMTIQDYFRKIRHRTVSLHPENVQHLRSKETDTSFARILDGKTSASDHRPRGLTIRDYLAKPVVIRPPIQTGEALSGRDAPIGPAVQTPPAVETAAAIDSVSMEGLPPGAAQPNRGISDDASRIDASIERAANRYSLPSALVRAVIKAESGFQVRAVSPAGAQGLMQLMPATAREMGVTDPFDIDQNIDGGSKYLRAMLDRFDGDVRLALSAYNAGPGAVARYNGKVPYAETRNYVTRVLRFARRST